MYPQETRFSRLGTIDCNFVLPNNKERIDHVSGTLWAEWRYFETLITEPVLAAETLQTQQKNAQRYSK
jgi:hypothetical protein